nr:hypothetical protein [Tanacetum cinerariifolium]
MCAMVGQLIQKKQEEKQIEEEQAANARYWKILACCDDDDDYNSAITPNEPVDSLSMGDEHLNTILATESDKFIKSCVENLIPNPSESEGESECDMPAREEFTTFSNILFNDLEDSLIMRNEELSTIPEKESDEVIKSSVEDFVPIPSKSKDISGSDSECDFPACDDFSPIDVQEGKSVTFSNPLFDSNVNFTFSDDESLSYDDVPEDNVKIYSNPLFEFDDEYIFNNVNPLFDKVLEDIESNASYNSNLDDLALLVTPLFDSNEDECFDVGGDVDESNAFDIPSDIKDGYYDSKGDVLYLNSLLSDDTTLKIPPEVFLGHDPRSLSDINDLKIMVKVFNLRILEKFFSLTYVSLPFKDRHDLSLTYVI